MIHSHTHAHITSCVVYAKFKSCCQVRNLSLDIEIENQLFRRMIERKNELIQKSEAMCTHIAHTPETKQLPLIANNHSDWLNEKEITFVAKYICAHIYVVHRHTYP